MPSSKTKNSKTTSKAEGKCRKPASSVPSKFPFTANNVDVAREGKHVEARWGGHLLRRFGADTTVSEAYHAVRAWTTREFSTVGKTLTVDLATNNLWDSTTGRAVRSPGEPMQ